MVKKAAGGSKKPQGKKSRAPVQDSEDDDESNLDAGIKFENLEFDDDYGNEEEDSGSIEDLAGRIKFDDQPMSEGNEEEEDGGGDIDEPESDDDASDTEELKSLKKSLKPVNAKAADESEAKKEAEERKKKKRIEQLDKRIKKLVTKHDKEKVIVREASEIKNKLKRQEVVVRKRQAKQEGRMIDRLKKRKVREEQGEAAMPKGKTNTIESMRVADETLIEDGEDEEIKGEQEIDEFSQYFKNMTTPKILMTTNRRPKGNIFAFLKEMKEAIPAVEYYERKNFKVKDIIEWGKRRGYTDLLLWYEKHGNPHTLIISHLPEGPTATFRISGVKLRETLPNHGRPTSHDYSPELIMNNFDTMTGTRIGRMLAALFPQSPNFRGRRVITFHNQRDFIFFRHHRYEFLPDGSRANLQECGPRFTLKLHALQLGTLDSKFGEYEFIYKPRMGVNRKQMYL